MIIILSEKDTAHVFVNPNDFVRFCLKLSFVFFPSTMNKMSEEFNEIISAKHIDTNQIGECCVMVNGRKILEALDFVCTQRTGEFNMVSKYWRRQNKAKKK